jgi:hypothetical protein
VLRTVFDEATYKERPLYIDHGGSEGAEKLLVGKVTRLEEEVGIILFLEAGQYSSSDFLFPMQPIKHEEEEILCFDRYLF